jgi:protein-disulfide isomerase
LEKYEGQIRFVYRDFPVLGNNSTGAALAAECADDQGMFWEYLDLLFANQGQLGFDMFLQLAGDLELDIDQFTTCVEEQTHVDEMTADFAAAVQIGAQGTPAFLINGRFVAGAQSLESFSIIIDEELANVETDE